MDIVHTDLAPRAIGPYSQAVRAGDLVFLSGQIPLDPATGELVAGGIREQAAQVLANVGAVLDAAGVARSAIVKATIFLTDLADFAAVNELYGESCVDKKHFDCVCFVRWCPKGINSTVSKFPSIKGYKKMCLPISESGAHPAYLHAGDLVFRNDFEHIGIAVGQASGLVIEAKVEASGVVVSGAANWEWHGRLPREFWLGLELPKK